MGAWPDGLITENVPSDVHTACSSVACRGRMALLSLQSSATFCTAMHGHLTLARMPTKLP